jgi:AraC family transcriptional regulator
VRSGTIQSTVDGALAIPGVVAEIRKIRWDTDDEVELSSDHYHFSCPLTSSQPYEKTTWRFAGSSRGVTANQFGLLPANFAVNFSRSRGNVASLYCMIEREYFEDITHIEHWTVEKVVRILKMKSPFIGMIFDRYVREIVRPGFASGELMSSLTHCLLVEIANGLREESPQPAWTGGLREWQLSALVQAINDKKAGEILRLDQLAALCGLSVRHLMRGFKAATGSTLHKYVEQVRLAKTKQLLADDDLQLKGIAADMGFASASHLTAAFKKLTGVTPSEYRFRLRAGDRADFKLRGAGSRGAQIAPRERAGPAASLSARLRDR